MKSDKKFRSTFDQYRVYSDDYLNPVENYILHGLHPGGMFTSIFANDILSASLRSHPKNDWNELIELCKWISHNAPTASWGSYEAVDAWCKMDADARTKICENKGLRTTAWDILKDKDPV